MVIQKVTWRPLRLDVSPLREEDWEREAAVRR